VSAEEVLVVSPHSECLFLVISEFNEWRVLLYGPNGTIHGTHQFSEAKAKEHAVSVARAYIRDRQQQALPDVAELTWVPTAPDDWLIWC
jgi:hypothetical protein